MQLIFGRRRKAGATVVVQEWDWSRQDVQGDTPSSAKPNCFCMSWKKYEVVFRKLLFQPAVMGKWEDCISLTVILLVCQTAVVHSELSPENDSLRPCGFRGLFGIIRFAFVVKWLTSVRRQVCSARCVPSSAQKLWAGRVASGDSWCILVQV